MTIVHQPEHCIANDNLSRFSTELKKANSFTAVQLVLQNNISYLFNCCVCRITYYEQKNFVCYTISGETPIVVTGTHQLMWDIEKLLFYEGLPLRLNAVEHGAILKNLPCKTSADKLWGWNLNYSEDAGILLTILADEEQPFLRKQIPLVKMMCEMLFNKLQLIGSETLLRKSNAQVTCKQPENSNTSVGNMVSTQKNVVEERTQERTQLNKQLIDIIRFNSHNGLEPLTHLIGLMPLKPLMSEDEFLKNCWPMMLNSVHNVNTPLNQ